MTTAPPDPVPGSPSHHAMRAQARTGGLGRPEASLPVAGDNRAVSGHACRSFWDAIWALGAGARADTGAPCRKASLGPSGGRGGHAGVDGGSRVWQTVRACPHLSKPVAFDGPRVRARRASRRATPHIRTTCGPALDVDTRLSMGRGPCRDSNAQRAEVEASAHLCQQASFGRLSALLEQGLAEASGSLPAGLGSAEAPAQGRMAWGPADGILGAVEGMSGHEPETAKAPRVRGGVGAFGGGAGSGSRKARHQPSNTCTRPALRR